MSPEILTLLGILISSGISFLTAYLLFRVQNKRVGPQNFKDGMEAAKNALEIAESATKKQLEQEQKIGELTRILKNTHYKVTVIFTLGEKPKVETASIEAIHEQVATR